MMVNLKVEKINKYQPHFEFNETYKELKEKSKARKDAEDFSLVFDKACQEVKNEISNEGHD